MTSNHRPSLPNGNRLPLFFFCGSFSGRYGQSGPAWIEKFEYEHMGCLADGSAIPPNVYFKTVKMLLVERAGTWARFALGLSSLLEKEELSQTDVAYFKQRFIAEFPDPSSSPTIPQKYVDEIESLIQDPTEDLHQFHARIKFHLQPMMMVCQKFPIQEKRRSMETAILELGKKNFQYGILDQDYRRASYASCYIDAGMSLDDLLEYIQNFTEEGYKAPRN
ncbi:MAG: hypothetical protein MMC33_002760 [Icmadophila ericetorum]|nr:hypothetical protein [Icmadophila ericetorum]